MIIIIIIILAVLWLLGYAPLSGAYVPNIVLFTLNNHPITLWEILIVAVIAWAIGILPRPFQAVASILLLLWVLSVLGIISIVGLSNIIILVIIIGLILTIFL